MRTAVLILLVGIPRQDDISKRVAAMAERARDFDPEVRTAAAKEAEELVRGNEKQVAALSTVPARIVLALAGKLKPEKLLESRDSAARDVGCDLLPVQKSHLAILMSFLEQKDAGLRISACLALGRLEDPALRAAIQGAVTKRLAKRPGPWNLLLWTLMSRWYRQSYALRVWMQAPEPESRELAAVALCRLSNLELASDDTERFAALAGDRALSPRLREALVNVTARQSLPSVLPLLLHSDRTVRSLAVDAVERGLKDPLEARLLHELAARKEAKTTDDGKTPSQPILSWIAKWLKRLCAENVTVESFETWWKENHRKILDRRVNEAILRGIEALRNMAEKDGSWSWVRTYPVGVTAMAVYTLLKCDVPFKDPAVAQGLELLLDKDPEGTYQASLAAMALATALEKRGSRDEKTARRLQAIADLLVASQDGSGGWSYGGRRSHHAFDFSNTQFALLGLRAAVNGGAKVPRSAWERALRLYDRAQTAEGGWGYGEGNSSTPSMTAAGAYGWMVCRLSLEERVVPKDLMKTAQMKKAIRAIEAFTSKAGALTQYGLYWLYSLERMCMNAGLERIGSIDWYEEGATWLVSAQRSDGSWRGQYREVVDTCFALLFLRKAFISRPDVQTGTPRASREQAEAVLKKRGEELRKIEGVLEVTMGQDERTAFLLVRVTSGVVEQDLRKKYGTAIDGVPLRVALP